MNQICLASASPRRRELLAMLPISFAVHAVDIEEERAPHESPQAYVTRLSFQKAQAGLARFPEFEWVLGADTIVTLGDEVLEKPTDFSDFKAMMQALSGAQHEVFTAVSLLSQQKHFPVTVRTTVEFRTLSEQDIEWYWQTQEPRDKAGGYGIQGYGGRFVKAIHGSYSAVVGLPLCETEALLSQAELLG